MDRIIRSLVLAFVAIVLTDWPKKSSYQKEKTVKSSSTPQVEEVKTVSILSRRQWIELSVLCLSFAAANWKFWTWWLHSERIGSPILFWMGIPAMFYLGTFLPGIYMLFLWSMKRPIEMAVLPDARVAVITLTVVGSESLGIVRRELEAIGAITYQHDSWILVDGKHSPEIEAMAKSMGVRYFCRHDTEKWGNDKVDFWNQRVPPHQAKTKAGNVNAWLDAFGGSYDFFVQFDIDHRPKSYYLDKVLGFFRDPKVAWVQPPSVYGNFPHCWIAKGAAELETILQGVLQQGFQGWSETPVIIGSHSTYRMSAVLEIGGFQPTRAEDHLDTLVLAKAGYRGVFLPEVIAIGDGPENFETFVSQQFAWAYSIIQVLFRHSLKALGKLTFQQKVQFLFQETWYPMWSLSTLVLFLLPVLALWSDQPIAHVSFLDFCLRYCPIGIVTTITWWWSRRWFQPRGLHLSWRGVVLHLARWPVVVDAFIQAVLNIQKPYMITPKGIKQNRFPVSSYWPYFLLFGIATSSVVKYLVSPPEGQAQGYLLFVLYSAFLLALVFLVPLGCDLVYQLRQVGWSAVFDRISQLGLASGIALILVISTYAAAPRITLALTYPTAGGSSTPSIIQHLIPVTVPSMKTLPSNRVWLGVYDIQRGFAGRQLDVEQDFVRWDKPDDIDVSITRILQSGRIPLITPEAWTTSSGKPENVLKDTIDGLNDQTIKGIARVVKSHNPQLIMIRWGHEMDIQGNYPWAPGNDGTLLYICAYRHVVDLFNEEGVSNVKFVWSPAGNSNSPAFYPGDDYVDFIGMTILESPEWDAKEGLPTRQFNDLLSEKYEILKRYGKPLIVAELGVAGNETFKRSWLSAAFLELDKFPLLSGVVYFNAPNAPTAFSTYLPDWRINSKDFPPS